MQCMIQCNVESQPVFKSYSSTSRINTSFLLASDTEIKLYTTAIPALALAVAKAKKRHSVKIEGEEEEEERTKHGNSIMNTESNTWNDMMRNAIQVLATPQHAHNSSTC